MGKDQLKVDSRGLEQRSLRKKDFPFSAGVAQISKYTDRRFCHHWHEDPEFTVIVEGEINYQVNDRVLKLKKGQKITIYPFTRDGMVVPEYSEHWTYKITIPKYIDEDETTLSAKGELYYNGGVRMGLNWGYLPFDIEFSVQQEGEQFIGTIKVTDIDGDVRSVTSVDFSQGVTIEVK